MPEKYLEWNPGKIPPFADLILEKTAVSFFNILGKVDKKGE